MGDFAYLHAHSEYSLEDGCMKIPEYLDRLEELAINAAALTDTHNLFGAFKFHQQAIGRGIKPVLGADIYFSTRREQRKKRAAHNRLRVLIENDPGYSNLSRLLSKSYSRRSDQGLFITRQELAEKKQGLFILGPPARGNGSPPLSHSTEEFESLIKEYNQLFGERFFAEIPVYGPLTNRQKQYLAACKANNIKAIITHPAYFSCPADREKLPLRLAIQKNRTLKQTRQLPDHRKKQFVTGKSTMQDWLDNHRDLLENTNELAQRCYFEFKTDSFYLPDYPATEDQTSAEYLRKLCENGLDEREIKASEETVKTRLAEELNIINSRGFADYFLIVADIVNRARNQGIVVGPGRGSAAGSLVSYLLGITEIDPLKYDLIFERFLNKQRREMPDIDLDFADRRRDEVIDYIVERFGGESVAQIITFGQLKARNSLRDVGRIRNEPQEKIENLLNLFPRDTSEPLTVIKDRYDGIDRALRENKELSEWYNQAQRLEGLVRNPSIHAAGILIGEGQLAQRLPLYYPDEEKALPASQFDMYDLNQLGYLKLDILGLTTLTLIELTLEKIPPDRRPSISDLPDADPEVAKLLVNKSLEGIFQFETPGNRDLVRRMAPKNRRDLMDCIALYRPGPLQSGIVDSYLNRRRGKEEVTYPHPELENILENTYGLVIYQEQVMAIARKIASFSWSRADRLRKAMGKKNTEIMASMREEFLQGAKENGYEEKWAKELFETLANFAQYGFNRSHSAAYGKITYRTAYLKAHFPLQFYAALCTVKSNDRDRIGRIARAMEEDDIKLLPPKINKSTAEFTVEEEAVRYGLKAIKHVGGRLARAITSCQQNEGFSGLKNFLSRIPPKRLRPKAFKSLAGAGYFDPFIEDRGGLVEQAEKLLNKGARDYRARESGQEDLFSKQDSNKILLAESNSHSWTFPRRTRAQKEALGYSPGGHPLHSFECFFPFLHPGKIQSLIEAEDKLSDNIAPPQVIALCEESFNRDETSYLRLLGEEEEAVLTTTVDPTAIPHYRVVLCELKQINGERIITSLTPLTQNSTPGLSIYLTPHQKYDQLRKIKELLARFSGSNPVRVILRPGEKNVRLDLQQNVSPEPELARGLNNLLGPGHTALFFRE